MFNLRKGYYQLIVKKTYICIIHKLHVRQPFRFLPLPVFFRCSASCLTSHALELFFILYVVALKCSASWLRAKLFFESRYSKAAFAPGVSVVCVIFLQRGFGTSIKLIILFSRFLFVPVSERRGDPGQNLVHYRSFTLIQANIT